VAGFDARYMGSGTEVSGSTQPSHEEVGMSGLDDPRNPRLIERDRVSRRGIFQLFSRGTHAGVVINVPSTCLNHELA
jgi:hypothetical protein